MNKWLILKNRIDMQIGDLNKEVERNKLLCCCRDNLKMFLDSRRDGTPKFEILDTLPNEILDKNEKKVLKSIYQRILTQNQSFNSQLTYNQMVATANKYIKKLYSKYDYLVGNDIKIKNYINLTEEMIKLYSKAYSIINDEGITEACSEELLNVIIDAITELDIDDKTMLQMIQELKQKNENLLKRNDNKINETVESSNNESVPLIDNENNFKKETTSEKTKDDIIIKGSRIIDDVKVIIDYFEQILKNYHELNINDEKYAKIYTQIEYLKGAINDYHESLALYINSNKRDDEAINYFYNELNNGYDKLLDEKIKLEMKQKFMDTCNEFYLPADKLKNLIVFIPIDDSEVSNMEYSLDNDENINTSAYNSIKLCLTRLLLGEEDVLTGHKAKTDNYSEEFLKKYHVKSIKASKCRIMYSRYSTTLNQKYPDLIGNPNVVFVFNAGYGDIDGNAKNDLYESGLSECFKYKDQIDKIRNLLNIDWSKLSANEAEQYDREIKMLFALQRRKMDHFLNTCVMKQNADAINKRTK